MNIEDLLLEQGVDFSTVDGQKLYKGYLPLEAFDDSSFDPREPEEWLAMGIDKQTNQRRGIPAKGLRFEDGCGRWKACGVLDYNGSNSRYQVQWESAGEVRSRLSACEHELCWPTHHCAFFVDGVAAAHPHSVHW